MARTSYNFTLEPEVGKSLEEFASLAGINNSAACNMLLKAVLNEQPQELHETMVGALLAQGKQKEGELLSEALEVL